MKIKKKHKRGYLDISFAWLFAIIVGVFILALAIYFSVKTINIGQTQIDAETAKKIEVLLNPIETGFESGQKSSITLPSETRIYAGCSNEGNFGTQTIRISQKNFNKWTDTNVNVPFYNKYIFAEEYVEGKKFFLFSKPFEFPFKVSDMIVIVPSSKSYCLIDTPESVREEISALKMDNIETSSANCTTSSVKICFNSVVGSSEGCNVNVQYNKDIGGESYGSVEKNKKTMYFNGDGLMYGAIFSDYSIYECQVRRLMQRTSQLAQVYKDKSGIVSQSGCNTNLDSDLIILGSLAKSLKSSRELSQIESNAKEIGDKNGEALCKLW